MPKPVHKPESLLIVSHVCHYRHRGQIYATGPYAREIDIWADLFPKVLIAAPCRDEIPAPDCVAFTRANIGIWALRETGGVTIKSKIAQLMAVPSLTWGLACAMRQADAIHVRCPGNLGLLGAVLAPLFSQYLIAKFAGQWNGYPGEAWTVRFQRALLHSRWWHGPVTVYGRWPNQPGKVTPFFTSVLSDDQLARARKAAARRQTGDRLRVLYVGRLTRPKNVHVLLEALAQLTADAIQIHCTVVGDGPQRQDLESLSIKLGLRDAVEFVGGVGFERVLEFYEQADVLALLSEAEGWGKVVIEAMAFGLLCIGSRRGLLPWMLGEGRGFVVEPADPAAVAATLRLIASAPEKWGPMRAKAAHWAQRYSLESLRDALAALLSAKWRIPVPEPALVSKPQPREIRA